MIREIYRISAIATDFGNGAKILVPRSWRGRKVYAILQEDPLWHQLKEMRKRAKTPIGEVTSG